jgi:uncharacterized protein (DUF3084 family)
MIDVKERLSRSFAPTVVKSKRTDVSCVMTTASCDETVGTCAEMCAISGAIGVMPAETKRDQPAIGGASISLGWSAAEPQVSTSKI